MSINVQNYVWSLDLKPSLKYVAIALADHAHEDGQEARPSQDFLATIRGFSVRYVRMCLKELLVMGVIKIVRPARNGRCTVYAFIPPKEGFGRNSTTVGRKSTTLWAEPHVPLTIENRHVKQREEVASEVVAKEAIANIKAVLRSPRKLQ